jgi:hypothetical protein
MESITAPLKPLAVLQPLPLNKHGDVCTFIVTSIDANYHIFIKEAEHPELFFITPLLLPVTVIP